ncbi:2-C-methyl-D-erythritol 4-phosphate cytidylyltransferase [Syntrophobacter sp. SbD1]|nr:2-C-methyl-D-erythritol 4-phosphate cytidylyltransferase [Syntrophobacter sp. SbD1]
MGGAVPKQFMCLAGKPILAHTLSALSNLPLISDIFLIVPEAHVPGVRDLVAERGRETPAISVAAGGAERRDSVYNGLKMLPAECDWVMIHDGVRPFASPRLIEAALEGARATGACIAAMPATDTVKRGRHGFVTETLYRDEIWLVQTPQVFHKQVLVSAYEKAVEAGWTGTDDASFVERMGVRVSIVHGERTNIKITTPEDLQWAEWFLATGAGGG